MNLYSKGIPIWVKDPTSVWTQAVITEIEDGSSISYKTDDGKIGSVDIADTSDLPPIQNPKILLGVNDVAKLSYLSEPAVLHNLSVRFLQNRSVYTYCGIVLVAVNPYCDLPTLYSKATMNMYKGRSVGELDPHVYAVAEEALTRMDRDKKNQSIIVSGESGAGKTVTAKTALQYFAAVGGPATATQADTSSSSTDRKILASSPIMEAMGNAKTIRNDNSSRFGKYLEIQFKNLQIVGASMRTYLLEKSRLVFQAPHERNYHIFYQMCHARDLPELAELGLKNAEEFQYLNQGDCCHVDGADDFAQTSAAFHQAGFSKSNVGEMLKVLAAILHLGNTVITDGEGDDSDSSRIPEEDPGIRLFSTLLDIPEASAKKWICARNIVIGKETIPKPINKEMAVQCRDALAKLIYSHLFEWTVDEINNSTKPPEKKSTFIGVLDIYGSETFEVNSFEQFCINYANEKLQQQFNKHVFKLEQAEYVNEGILWKMLNFQDNQPCIDMIEKPLGIIDLLDEECLFPNGSDKTLLNKLEDKWKMSNFFLVSKFGQKSFIIKHFMSDVEYEVHGFLEKNRDTVYEEQIQTLKLSGNKIIKSIFGDQIGLKSALKKPDNLPPKSAAISKKKKTVGSKFRDSLKQLIETLDSTTPHYIRCIKPNDDKSAFEFNPVRAVEQLRACGVIDTIRISAAGYPSRLAYLDFIERYRPLATSQEFSLDNLQETCSKIVKRLFEDPDKYQLGKSKIFFRAGQVALLERLRSEKLRYSAVLIQKRFRGGKERKRFVTIKAKTLVIQRWFRGVLARRLASDLRRTRAAIIIQKNLRCWLHKNRLMKMKRAACVLQRHFRGMIARRNAQDLRRIRKAVDIQAYFRGWSQRTKYKKTIAQIIMVQRKVRQFLARRRLEKLKESKSIDYQQPDHLNKGMENKIISLSKKVTTFENLCQELQKSLLDNQAEHLSEVQKYKAQIQQLEAEKQELSSSLADIKQSQAETLSLSAREREAAELRQATLEQEVGLLKLEIVDQAKNFEEEKSRYWDECQQEMELEKARLTAAHEKELFDHEALLQEFREQVQSGNVSTSSFDPQTNGESFLCSTPRKFLGGSMSRLDQSHLGPESNMMAANVASLSRKVGDSTKSNLKKDQKISKLQEELKLTKNVLAMFTKNLKKELDIYIKRFHFEMKACHEYFGNQEFHKFAEKHDEMTVNLIKQRLASLRLNLMVQEGAYKEDVSLLPIPKKPLKKLKKDEIIESFIDQLVKESEELKKSSEEAIEELEDEVETLTRRCNQLQKLNEMEIGSAQTDARFEFVVNQLSLQIQDLTATIEKLQKEKNADPKPVFKEGVQRTGAESLLKKKDGEVVGMIAYEKSHRPEILRYIIYDLDPKASVEMMPCLPAFFLFMMVRYNDHNGNDKKELEDLLEEAFGLILVKMRESSSTVKLETLGLWLSNLHALLNLLKQFSGESEFLPLRGEEDSSETESKLFRSFDFKAYWRKIDVYIFMYAEKVTKTIFSKVKPLLPVAIVERDPPAFEKLFVILKESFKVLQDQNVHTSALFKILWEIFDHMGVECFNTLMCRKDLLNWSTGEQISSKMSRLLNWAKELLGLDQPRKDKLEEAIRPLWQAAQLLQVPKTTEDDSKYIVQNFTRLLGDQIVYILMQFSPKDDFEATIEHDFIEKLVPSLKSRRLDWRIQPGFLLTERKFLDDRLPFVRSDVELEKIKLHPNYKNLEGLVSIL